MLVDVEILQSGRELESVAPFRVETLLWGTKKIPETYGYLGYVPGDGFYLKMVCQEPEPLRKHTADLDPVYQDSAMEAFFLFDSEKEGEGLPVYVNFEANANGALLAAYGEERVHRSYFLKEEMKAFACKAQINPDSWNITLKIPQKILEKIYGPLRLEEGSVFYCNFYKISETAACEHYASYSPVLARTPNFHLPEFFASAKLVRREV